MRMWKFHAFRLHGDGTETPVAWDIPLTNAIVVEDLSGPGELQGTIQPEMMRLKGSDGEPIFVPWATAVYAEFNGQLRGGFIVEDRSVDGPTLTLTMPGFAAYLTGLPYTSTYSKIGVDPLDVVRHIWKHVQSEPGGNLGVKVDSTTSPVRIGTKQKETNFTTSAGEDVSFESGPYTLMWYDTEDLGKELNDLATETPFDYRLTHTWSGETPKHRFQIGYPTIGGRKKNLRLVVGENILDQPQLLDSGEDYASEVLLLGAGEGSKMVRGSAQKVTGRLRRVRVITDKSVKSRKRANDMAGAELKLALADWDFTEVKVVDHPNARLSQFQVGDEVLVRVPAGWNGALELWVRILTIAWNVGEDTAVLTVVRSEKT